MLESSHWRSMGRSNCAAASSSGVTVVSPEPVYSAVVRTDIAVLGIATEACVGAGMNADVVAGAGRVATSTTGTTISGLADFTEAASPAARAPSAEATASAGSTALGAGSGMRACVSRPIARADTGVTAVGGSVGGLAVAGRAASDTVGTMGARVGAGGAVVG
jgi:hypothetical protein